MTIQSAFRMMIRLIIIECNVLADVKHHLRVEGKGKVRVLDPFDGAIVLKDRSCVVSSLID